mmetsp:Transcript_51309/g.166378  ORF Transcript_51309/g.166378 Transcript_51309/m.166378 type:complete len:124 (+) Transcript_51309:174-545(+)
MAILKKHPSASEPALNHLKDFGYNMDGDGEHVVKSKCAKATDNRVQARKAVCSKDHVTLPPNAKDLPDETLVPLKGETLGGLTVPQLAKHVLTPVEPTTLSMSNLRSMSLRGGFDSTKTEFER